MKPVLILLLMLALTGCAADPEETQIPTTEVPAVVTEPSGSYYPDSTLEMFTGGAVREYPQQIPDIYAIAAAGSDVLVFSGRDDTTITRLTGENLFRVAEITLNVRLDPGQPGLLITQDRMVYFDDHTRELVWLDENFREFSRLQMPENLTGTPVITADRLKVYYCTADGLRVLDVESGISRLVKQMSYPGQQVTGLLLDHSVVQISDSQGNHMFLDGATGSLLGEAEGLGIVTSQGSRYCGYRTQEGKTAVLFGSAGEQPRELKPEMADGQTTLLTDSCAALSYGQAENRWQLHYYDLTSGRRTAAVVLPERVTPRQYAADAEQGRIYFLCYGEAESQILCRWDLNMSRTGEETDYSAAYYTADAPDLDGLARCAARAAELSRQYGVEIRVYEDALELKNADYRLDLCWRTEDLEFMLDTLEALFAAFPEDFLPKTVETMGGKLYIHLLGSVEGPEGDLGGQFWQGQDAHLLLTPAPRMASSFLHGLFHTMETRLLSKSIALYRWDELNPDGFEYDYDFAANLEREGGIWLDDNATRAFTDTYAMSFPREDQACIFAHACEEGNEDFFRSAVMQKKLRAVCTGIREAWGLKKSQDSFLWEQYLESPLAYVKK